MLWESLNSIADLELCLLEPMSAEGICSEKPPAGMVETAMLRWGRDGRDGRGVCDMFGKLGYRRGQRSHMLVFQANKAADSHRASATCTPCLIGNDVPDSTHQPLRMFAGVHKHSQSRHAAAERIETAGYQEGEGGEQQHGVGGGGVTRRWLM